MAHAPIWIRQVASNDVLVFLLELARPRSCRKPAGVRQSCPRREGPDRRWTTPSKRESFVSTPKAELVGRRCFPTREAAKTAIFEYLETFYNTRRLHSGLGYMSPAEFEEGRMKEAKVA